MTTTLSIGLDATQRSMLERLVIRARVLLEKDLASQAEGRFGMHADGTIEDEAALPDDTTDKITRRDLEQIAAHFRTLGEDEPGAVARLLREASFTHLNRLVAIRIAEAIGLVPESLASGPQSRGFRDLGEIMPVLAGDYRAYVRLCGDELAADAPALFDPRNPLLALEPSTAAFDELVGLMSDPQAIGIWPAPDTLGWAYQFFNTGDERREMREAAAPRNSHELAVRNQFFTPRYVVDFLVQNTIGRRLIENDPTSRLIDALPLLVDPPTESGPSLNLEDVKCLDPACGSGHFLLGCYDVLERAWELAGIAPADSAPKIVASLWGVDIDARCAQVASAAIVLRARRHCRDRALPRPNIVTARGLPGGSAALPPGTRLTAMQRSLIDRVSEVLAAAPLLGVLLKAEDALDEEIRHGVFGGTVGRKAGMLELTGDAAETTERELLSHLQAIADQASSSVVERLLAAEADDALRLVEVVRQRYDAVLMNPPFGEPVPETKPYLQKSYGWMPRRTCDLLASFVGRGLELCRVDGYLGAITSRSGLFLSTFEKWRRDVLLDNRLTALVDFGYGVMEQAMVEAAAYVIGPGRPPPGHQATFVRLLKDADRAQAMRNAIESDRAGSTDPRVFRMNPADLDLLPGAPLAYWISPSVRRLFAELPMVEGHAAEVRQGLATADNFRFVRTFWEVLPTKIGRTRAETLAGARWVPFAKGGDYSPYWSDVHLLVDWEDDGSRVKAHVDQQYPYLNGKIEWVVKNQEYYFRAGVTWPERTASGFGPRVLPAGCIFSHVGHGAFALGDASPLLAVMNTRLFATLIAAFLAAGEEATSGSPAKRYSVGSVQSTPWLGALLDDEARNRITADLTTICRQIAKSDEIDETARLFIGPGALMHGGHGVRAAAAASVEASEDAALVAIEASLEIQRIVDSACGVTADAVGYVNDEWGHHPADYPLTALSNAEVSELAELYVTPTEALIDRLVVLRGASKSIVLQNFIANRRLEILSHAFERNPRVLQRARRDLGLLPPEEPKKSAADLFSYLVGAALGRWDVRVGRDFSRASPAPGLFDPVPACPPAMLVGSDGMPSDVVPADYPLQLSPNRVLIDEPGHVWDVEAAVHSAAGILFDDPTAVIEEMLHILGRRSIRDHLRKQFFKDHLSRYSKSRRKAPIYWPLTVPSRNWGVWVYAPTLARETLYVVASEAARRERLAGEAIARLQREQREGRSGRPTRKVVEELDVEEKLAEELRRFRSGAERIAGLGWVPDLDDGIVLCAAPFADLFPSWTNAKTAREELREGKYEWATVAAWANQL